MSRSAFSFEDLIAPVTPEEFFDKFWEKDRLYLERDSDFAETYKQFFSIDDIDRWLSVADEEKADSIVVAPPAGTEQGSQRYAPGEISRRTLYEAFATGHSIVLNRLHLSWHPLTRLTRAVGKPFLADVTCNVYLTPKGSKTFPVHFDGHDVFVLQVHGSKDWRLHEFEHLPMSRYSYRKDISFPSWWSAPGDAPLLEELTLREGDLLYIPRGMPHCAVATEETSLHMTIGVNPLYWVDFMKMAIEQTCFAVPEMRKALPGSLVSDEATHEAMRAQFSKMLTDFAEAVNFDHVMEVVRRERLQKQSFPGDDHFGQLLRLQELSIDDQLERREHVLVVVEPLNDYGVCSIRFGEAHVRGPLRLQEAFEFVRDHERFSVSDLPGLDEQSKVVLARRLIRDGLLRVCRNGGASEEWRESVMEVVGA